MVFLKNGPYGICRHISLKLCLENKKRMKNKPFFILFLFIRDPAGIRTQDPIIKSDVLYQLSYRVCYFKFRLLCELPST